MNVPLEDLVDRAALLRSVEGDARAILNLLTPGRVVNVISMECALDPRLNREPPLCPTPDETGTYRGNYEDRRRWEERQPIAEQRARAALATLMMLGLAEEERDTDRFNVSKPNFYFKRTTWR